MDEEPKEQIVESTKTGETVDRDDKGRFVAGHTKMGGRKKGKSLKEYDREKFRNMTDDEKEKFLETITSELRYRMAEGNPHNTTDLDVEINPTPLLDGLFNNTSSTKDSETPKEN